METVTATPVQEEVKTAETETNSAGKNLKKKEAKINSSQVYFENAKIVCACGNTFTTGSTKEEIRVEICSNCHPFYTGQEKFVDTEGRVERFQRRTAAKQEVKPKKESGHKDERPKTLKEMLEALDKG